MRDIKAMLPEEIAAALAEMGQPKYRAKQIFQWLARGVTSFDEMTNLSKDLRAALSERFFISNELSPRQHRLHLLAGRLPAGVRVLRVDDRRPDPQS